MMKAVLLDGKGHARTIEKDVPALKKGYALVKMMAAGICGTDIDMLFHSPNQSDVTPGHEVAGIVHKVNGCEKFGVGDRVFLNCHITCNACEACAEGNFIFCKDLRCIGWEEDGGDAEYLAVPETILRKLPDDITYGQGVLLTDALGTPFHAAKKAEIKKGEVVAVSGVGPLGIMCILSVLYLGGTVVAIDVIDERLEAAKKFGAQYAVNGRGDVLKAIDEITGGKGLDKAIDCSGSARAIQTDLDALKNRGTMVQVGVCTSITLDLFRSFINKEVTLKGSRNFHDTELPEMIDLIRRTPNINDVLTHQFRLDQAQEAFETADRKEGLKILFVPNDSK